MTRTAARPPPIAIICLRFSAARRFRTLRASITSRREGMALDVSAVSAIVSVEDAITDFFGIDVELFEPCLRAFFFPVFDFADANAISVEVFTLRAGRSVVSGIATPFDRL